MSTREAYQLKLEGQLNEWKAEFDRLKAVAQQKTGEASLAVEERLDALQRKQDAAREKLDALKDASNDAWERLRSGVEEAWTDLERAFEEARERMT